MNIQVRYYTRSGNTLKLAEAVAQTVGAQAQPVSEALAERADLVFLGCSYYAFDVDEAVKSFLKRNRENIGAVVCFGTSAMMKSVYRPMKKIAEEVGLCLWPEEFHCRGEFGLLHKGRPNIEDLKNAALFAKKVVEVHEQAEL